MSSVFEKNVNNFVRHKEMIVTSLVILACLILFFFFPIRDTLQSLTGSLFLLVLTPILYIKLILGKKVRDYGLNLDNKRAGIILGTLMFFALSLIFYILFHYADFGVKYVVPWAVVENFKTFLLYELIFVNLFIFICEFFFRGFIMFSFLKKLGYWSIFLQFIIFLLVFFLSGNLGWQFFPFLAISFFSGIITYITRSIVYAYAFSFLFVIILDSYLIYQLK
jgi:membrane protease YdiL (CAAX protease family)